VAGSFEHCNEPSGSTLFWLHKSKMVFQYSIQFLSVIVRLRSAKLTDILPPKRNATSQIKRKSKVVPVLNYVPRHEDAFGEWRYNSKHSEPRH
jgi:hypothetical protein